MLFWGQISLEKFVSESVKKAYPYSNSPTAGAATEKKAKTMVDEEDDELSANTTASHYIGGRCGKALENPGLAFGLGSASSQPPNARSKLQ